MLESSFCARVARETIARKGKSIMRESMSELANRRKLDSSLDTLMVQLLEFSPLLLLVEPATAGAAFACPLEFNRLEAKVS